MRKETFELNEEQLNAICGFFPFEMTSPNGKPMLGLSLDYLSLFGVTEESKRETSYYIFLKKSWPIRIGFQLIWFGIKNAIKNLYVKGDSNAES